MAMRALLPRMDVTGGKPLRWLWALPVLLAALTGANVLVNGFGWDDNQIISALATSDSKTGGAEGSSDPSKILSSYYRPVVDLSYRLDYRLWGGRPFGYHLPIWLAHVLNTALVFFLARGWRADATGSNRFLPVTAASLFAVHPAHAEAVAWIAGRSDVYCAAFLLTSVLLYTHFRRTGRELLFGFSMVFFIMALLTKEMAIGVVLLFPLVDLLRSTREAVPQRWSPRWLVPIGLVGLYLWRRAVVIENPIGSVGSAGLDPSRVGEAVAALGYYLKLMIFPYPHQPFVAALPTGPAFMAVALLGGVVVLVGIGRAVVRGDAAVGAGLAWTVLTIAPAAALPMIGYAAAPVAERYAYVATAGFLIAAVALIFRAADGIRGAGPRLEKVWFVAPLLLVLLVGVWGMNLNQRNTIWKNLYTFWTAAVASAQDAGIPNRELGKIYIRQGRKLEAERLYLRALADFDRERGSENALSATVWEDLGALYVSQNRVKEAEGAYLRAIEVWEKLGGPEDPAVAPGLHNLAKLYLESGQYAEAEPAFRRAIEVWETGLGPDHPIVAAELHGLAVLYHVQGRQAEAEPLYRRAIAIQETSVPSGNFGLAQMLQDLAALKQIQKKYGEAEALYLRSIAIREEGGKAEDPRLAAGLKNLAELYGDRGDLARARPLYERSIQILDEALGPDHPASVTSRRQYAALLKKFGREKEAVHWAPHVPASRHSPVAGPESPGEPL